MVEEKIDVQSCPLCGADNQCAMAAGKAAEQCWCTQVTISSEALEAIPKNDRGVRCICPRCASSTGGD